MNQTHCLKLNMRFANAVKRGEKNFEIRKNDRGYQKGDTVVFRIVDDEGKTPYDPKMSPLYNRLYEITYVLTGWGLKEDYCVFGIREIDTKTEFPAAYKICKNCGFYDHGENESETWSLCKASPGQYVTTEEKGYCHRFWDKCEDDA